MIWIWGHLMVEFYKKKPCPLLLNSRFHLLSSPWTEVSRIILLIMCHLQKATALACRQDSQTHTLHHSKVSVYASASMLPSHMSKLPMPQVLKHPHTLTDDGFCPFHRQHPFSSSLSLCPSEMSFCSEKSAEFPSIFYMWLPLCITKFPVQFLDEAADRVKWKWFFKLLLKLIRITWLRVQQCLAALICFQWDFPRLPVAFTMMCSVYVERPKFFAILPWEKHILFHLWFFDSVWHKAVNYDPTLFGKTNAISMLVQPLCMWVLQMHICML